MSTPKRKPLSINPSTFLPDYTQQTKIRTTTRENSQRSDDLYSRTCIKSTKYTVIEPEQQSSRKKSYSSSIKLNLHSDTQQLYQRMNDLYIAREVKLKLKKQEQQIKDCIYNKKKQNLLKNSYAKLMSVKENQSARQKNCPLESKYTFEDFDSFRKI